MRLQLLKALAVSQVLPVACPENSTLSVSWSAAFLAPVAQHMLECKGGEDRALCEMIVHSCVCSLQVHSGPDTVVRGLL